ncbi:MAG: AAA family ATPase [Proteobacteria bacterium]|nr:AAA family ATPase [Pseudomonadota bacterium]
MYLRHFKLNEQPFEPSPDPDFLYLSNFHERARSYMESVWDFPNGIVSMTGEIGAGKTTLINAFIDRLDDEVCLANMNQTQLSPVQFLQLLLAQFGFKPFRKRKAQLLDMLAHFLSEKAAAGKKTLIIIDEAQNLSKNVLKDIGRMFVDEQRKFAALRIILSGHSHLNDTMDAAGIQGLVRLRLDLGSLNKQETCAYVLHRLAVAGAAGTELFTKAALAGVYRYSGGIPRLINTLCDTAMIGAGSQDQETVNEDAIEAAARELKWQEATAETNEHAVMVPLLNLPDAKRFGILSIAYKGRTTNEFPLSMGKLLIGRATSNDLQIDSKFVSGHHAQIITGADGKSLIEDLNSTNGLFIGKRKIRRYKLASGDIIGLGQHTITYYKERRETRRRKD